jgi:hypothetical protein
MNDEVFLKRLEKEAERQESFEYELLKTAALRKLFFIEFGYNPVTHEQLFVWGKDKYPNSIDPYSVLTQDEIVQVWEDAEDPKLQ